MKKLTLLLLLLTIGFANAQQNQLKTNRTAQISIFINEMNVNEKANVLYKPLDEKLFNQIKLYYKQSKKGKAILAIPLKEEYLAQLKKYHNVK